ncbi:aurora kinase A- and ninein-interacting protein [Pelodytes ibericus]
MKAKGSRNSQSQPEECGVWLDTTELKRRPKQMLLPCSSSKQFNLISRKKTPNHFPFDFTQTRALQPCTKQTSMYSFFTPSGKKNIQHPNSDPLSLEPENTPYKENTKENGEMNLLDSLSQQRCPLPPHTLENSGSFECMKNTCGTEDGESSDHYDSWEDTIKQTRTPQHEKGFVPEDAIPAQINPRSSRSLYQVHEDLENSMLPSKDWLRTRNATSKKTVSYFVNDPPGCRPLSEDFSNKAQDSLLQSFRVSQLFTQDSQGNKVISHRPLNDQKWNGCTSFPLQDRTNITLDISGSPCEEESLQRIFTQDSEGNLVMKHSQI